MTRGAELVNLHETVRLNAESDQMLRVMPAAALQVPAEGGTRGEMPMRGLLRLFSVNLAISKRRSGRMVCSSILYICPRA